MAVTKKPKKEKKIPEFVYPETYYQFLYKIRTAWTGYDIPVRVCVNELYLEAYLRPTDNASTEDEVLNRSKKVTLAYLHTNVPDEITVGLRNIYPTGRKVLQFNKDQLSDCIIADSKLPKTYIPKPNITVSLINTLFESIFPACRFTMDEVCCMLGLDFLDQAEQAVVKPIIVQELGKYKQDKEKRYCLITHEWKQSFLYKKKMELLPVANSITELKEIYKDCTLCHLGTKRKARGSPVVFGRGKDSKLDLFLIGEAPGTQEERDGIPFNPVAPAGSILDKVMKAVGIDQADCWISNSVICRPAPEEGEKGENGKPDSESIDYCNARLKNEIAILQPKVVVLLGSVAYRAFYGKDIEHITKNVGWADQNGSIKTYVLLHPSYIARQLSFAQKDEVKTADIKQEYLNHWLEIKKAITQ